MLAVGTEWFEQQHKNILYNQSYRKKRSNSKKKKNILTTEYYYLLGVKQIFNSFKHNMHITSFPISCISNFTVWADIGTIRALRFLLTSAVSVIKRVWKSISIYGQCIQMYGRTPSALLADVTKSIACSNVILGYSFSIEILPIAVRFFFFKTIYKKPPQFNMFCNIQIKKACYS